MEKKHPLKEGRKTVEVIDFEEDEAEKLELVKNTWG